MEYSCDIHTTYQASYYCTDCEVLICKLCCRYGNHTIIPLHETACLMYMHDAHTALQHINRLFLRYSPRATEANKIAFMRKLTPALVFAQMFNSTEDIKRDNNSTQCLHGSSININNEILETLSERILKLEQRECPSVGSIIASKIESQIKSIESRLDKYKIVDEVMSYIQPKLDKLMNEVNSKILIFQKDKLANYHCEITKLLNELKEIPEEQLQQKNEVIEYAKKSLHDLSDPNSLKDGKIEEKSQTTINNIKRTIVFTRFRSELNAVQKLYTLANIKEFDETISLIKDIDKKVLEIGSSDKWETQINSYQQELSSLKESYEESLAKIKQQKLNGEIAESIRNDMEKYPSFPKLSEIGGTAIENIKSGNGNSASIIQQYCKCKNAIVVEAYVNTARNRIDPRALKSIDKLKLLREKYCKLESTIDTFPQQQKALECEIAVVEEMAKKEVIEVSQPNIIHYCYEKGLAVVIYDPKAGGKMSFNLTNRINIYAESIAVGRKVYFIGGDVPIIETVIEIDLTSIVPVMNDMQPLLNPKCYHGLCTINDLIFCIGGFNQGSLTDCQLFSISKNTWYQYHDLNIARRSPAVFVYNKDFVYCVGGNLNNNHINSIERCSLSGKNPWEIVKANGSFQGRSNAHAIQYGKNEVVIFGGFIGHMILTASVTLKINGNTHTFEPIASTMKLPSQFYCTAAPILANGNVYGVDYKKNLHCFYSKTKDWAII